MVSLVPNITTETNNTIASPTVCQRSVFGTLNVLDLTLAFFSANLQNGFQYFFSRTRYIALSKKTEDNYICEEKEV